VATNFELPKLSVLCCFKVGFLFSCSTTLVASVEPAIIPFARFIFKDASTIFFGSRRILQSSRPSPPPVAQGMLNFSASRTNSANDPARIFCMTPLGWILPVNSVVPSLAAICYEPQHFAFSLRQQVVPCTLFGNLSLVLSICAVALETQIASQNSRSSLLLETKGIDGSRKKTVHHCMFKSPATPDPIRMETGVLGSARKRNLLSSGKLSATGQP
jgi:hypothetical protein